MRAKFVRSNTIFERAPADRRLIRSAVEIPRPGKVRTRPNSRGRADRVDTMFETRAKQPSGVSRAGYTRTNIAPRGLCARAINYRKLISIYGNDDREPNRVFLGTAQSSHEIYGVHVCSFSRKSSPPRACRYKRLFEYIAYFYRRSPPTIITTNIIVIIISCNNTSPII